MQITPEEIKTAIKSIPTVDTETLSHTYKVYHCSPDKAVQIVTKPLLEAILKELRTRTKPLPDLTLGLDKKSKITEEDETEKE